MTDVDIKEFKENIIDCLVRNYNMNKAEAYDAVQNSCLPKALQNDMHYAEHDSVEEWAEVIASP